MKDCEKVTLIKEQPSPRRMSPVVDEISSTTSWIVQGEGSSSHDQPVAIADEHNVLLSVVVESPLPPPPPPPQPGVLDEFLSSIMNAEAMSGETNKHKIPRVPLMLRQMETKKYYDPQLVSIGPYHHNDTNLKSFEKLKFQFTREFAKSCEPRYSIAELYNEVAQVVGEARSCYAEGTTEGIDDGDFTRMMFLDGCFILQFISWIVKDEELKMSYKIALVQRDLFLLENQLPFIVLRQLMKTRVCMSDIDKFLNTIRGTHLPVKEPPVIHVHLLEKMWDDMNYHRGNYYSRNRNQHGSGRSSYLFPNRSAMDLKMVGIQFRPSPHGDDLSYIAFKSTWNGGILRLPKINIDDATISLLMNMAAYEQCLDTAVDHFWVTNYICFLDSIINSVDDVKELKYAGIIFSFLGSDEEVVNVIHGMAAGLVPHYGDTIYFLVKSRFEKCHSYERTTQIAFWISDVMRDHFRSPWTTIALLAAVFALFLTTVQTYFAAFPHTDKCQESICNYLKNSTLKSNGG